MIAMPHKQSSLAEIPGDFLGCFSRPGERKRGNTQMKIAEPLNSVQSYLADSQQPLNQLFGQSQFICLYLSERFIKSGRKSSRRLVVGQVWQFCQIPDRCRRACDNWNKAACAN